MSVAHCAQGLDSDGLDAVSRGNICECALIVQGNCDTDATPEFLEALNQEVPVMPRTPGMCMLLAPTDVLYHRSGNLWLENLYIRVARNASSVNTALTMLSVSDPAFDTHLWVTNSILQGDGGLKVNGLTVSSKAYVGGVTQLLARRLGI